MRVLTAALLVISLISGCVADQSRDVRRDLSYADAAPAEVERHGTRGHAVAKLFNTGEIGEIRRVDSGAAAGLRVHEFYAVEIAEDPLNPLVTTRVGYVRKLADEGEDLALFEFYDFGWTRIAYLTEAGDLYRIDEGRQDFLGRHQLDAAVAELFPAQGGYGYDSEMQDRSIASMHDPEVSGLDPRSRGVYHRTHRSAPPVIAYTPYRPGEARLLADSYEKDRFDERMRERYQRIKEQQGAKDANLDDRYSNSTKYRWKDGNPVDDQGRPVNPHHEND